MSDCVDKSGARWHWVNLKWDRFTSFTFGFSMATLLNTILGWIS